MASLGLFGDDEAEVQAAPKEADVFKNSGKIDEQDKPLEMPDTSESYEPQVRSGLTCTMESLPAHHPVSPPAQTERCIN
jgi:hypothetical protein